MFTTCTAFVKTGTEASYLRLGINEENNGDVTLKRHFDLHVMVKAKRSNPAGLSLPFLTATDRSPVDF